MASTQHFESGLNKWLPTDKPMRMDFVNDNRIIDEYIRSTSTLPLSYTKDLEAEDARVSHYFKTPQNVVHVNFAVKRKDGGMFSSGAHIATLPPNFLG